MVGYMFIVNCERMFLLNAPFISDSYVAVYWSVCTSYVAVYWSVCPSYVAVYWSVCPSYVVVYWSVCPSYVAVYWSVCPSYVAVYWSVCTKLFLTPWLDNNELDPFNISEHLKYAENNIFFLKFHHFLFLNGARLFKCLMEHAVYHHHHIT